MKRPLLLVTGAAVAGLLIAGIGASAHTLVPAGFRGTHASASNDEASGARTESPEAAESPEPSPSPEPAESPEPSPSPETEQPEPPDMETADTNDEDGGGDTGGSGD